MKDKITIKDGMDFFFNTREAHPLTIFNDTLKIEILGFDSFIGLRLNWLFSVPAQICYALPCMFGNVKHGDFSKLIDLEYIVVTLLP